MAIVSVDDLLLRPFSLRTLIEKEDIIRGGKPTPELPQLKLAHKERTREYIRHFSLKQYYSSEWLTGCDKRSKLFCWPCLLFAIESGVWSKTGYDDLRCLSKMMKRHEQSASHLRNHLKLKMFGKHSIDELTNQQLLLRKSAHNEMVKKNIGIMKRLIDCVCFVAKQELLFPGHESENSLNRGNYLECLDLVRMYDAILDEHLKTSTIFQATAPSLQSDLIEAISVTVRNYIKNEIRESSFASIMLDETCDSSCKSHLSTVLRYVHKGQTHERFIGFTDMSSNKTADALYDHVVDVVSEYELRDKLVGQTYDGGSVMSGHLYGLQRMVQEKYPRALFFHCYAHVLNLILQQSLNSVNECRMFFKLLTGLSEFFSNSPKRIRAFVEFDNKRLPGNIDTQWCSLSRIVNTVYDEWSKLCEFFAHVSNDYDGKWDDDSIIKAKGFHVFLNDFRTVLFIEIFANIFSKIDVLYNILQTRSYDISFCSMKIIETSKQLHDDREIQFDNLWCAALSKLFSNESAHTEDAQKRRKTVDIDEMRRTYYEIIDNVCNQIDQRYRCFEILEFCSLLYYSKYVEYRAKFPESILNEMKEIYGSTFDYIKLKNELNLLYTSPDFYGKSVHDLTLFMRNNDLISIFPETFKLAELILTIPSTAVSIQSSGLNRIHSFFRRIQRQERLTNLGIISIERGVLDHLRNSDTLYENVIQEFRRINRRIELEFK